MPRRLLPTLIALGCGLLALGWGLFSLQRIFSREREDAHAQIRSRREALEHTATVALRQALTQRLVGSIGAIEGAVADPLVPGEGFYYSLFGIQMLPVFDSFRPGSDMPARDAYEALATQPQDSPAVRPWEKRLARLHAAEAALLAGDTARANTWVEELLRYHHLNPLPPEQELPFLMLAVERLQRGPTGTEPLVKGLLREPLPDEYGGIARSMGLQKDLLRARARLTEADFEFLKQRIVRLSSALKEPVSDFEARAREKPLGPLGMPRRVNGPTLVGPSGTEGRWWFLQPAQDKVYGFQVDLDRQLASIAEDMHARGLFGADGRVRLEPTGEPQPLDTLRLSVDVPQSALAEADIEALYGLKTLLVGMVGALAVAIVAISAVAQQRKNRFLELKSDFVATVSHELRTPLASIRLMGETLERKLAQSPEVRDYPARIVQAADGLHFLVENILSFNRIDKGRWKLRTSRVRLEELIPLLRDDLASATTVPVHLSADMGDAELEADPSLLRMLFSNLGRNACAYNHRSPVEISISAEVFPGHGCTVLFRDNGMGIPESEWENVFLEFYRVTTPGHEVHGSGLGLALCRRIMKLHKGDIQVVSSGPEGTTFALTFLETA